MLEGPPEHRLSFSSVDIITIELLAEIVGSRAVTGMASSNGRLSHGLQLQL